MGHGERLLNGEFMKVLSALLFGLVVTSTFGQTSFSGLVQYVQKTYADKFEKYPILIFDMDEVELRYAKANAFGEGKEKEKERAAIVKAYVLEKTGVELQDNEAMTYESYTTVLKSGAYAMPTLDRSGGWGEVNYKMCAVFPASPNSNQRLETERITGLKTPGAYEDITYTGLQEKLTFEEMQQFSLYHELGHCLDQDFMPQNYAAYEVSPHDVHESESYAEVFALMMLEREGFKGTGRTRALLRNMYTQEMGRWFIENPNNGFGNPLYLQGGVIYYLAPTLLAANEFVKRNGDFVKGDVTAILAKAKEIVDEYALDGRSFTAIFRGMQEGTDKMFAEYREWSTRNPSFFTQAYKDMLHFFDYSPYLFTQIVGNEPDNNEGEELAPLNPADYCALEGVSLQNYVELMREELMTSSPSYASAQKRQEELNKIYESYSKCGKGETFKD